MDQTSTVPRSMEVLGVEPVEERLYRFLLGEGPSSESELARAVHLGNAQVRKALASLESKGLLSRSSHRRPLFSAISPDLALDGLLSSRKQELDEARAVATELISEFRALPSGGRSSEVVEIATGRKAITQRGIQMQRSAKEQVRIFDTPPYAMGSGENKVEVELLQRGIGYRVIYDRVALEYPGQLDVLQRIIEQGEEARVVERLPLKMGIIDSSTAMLPLHLPEPRQRPQRMIVHASPMLDALMALFESVWERATPIRSAGTAQVEAASDDPAFSDDDRALLMLMAADLKDEAIGRQLGITRRSVQRRIRRLMGLVGVSSRTHLLLYCARKGWL